MTALDLQGLEAGALRGLVAMGPPGAVTVRLLGTAESDAMGPLEGLLTRLHAEALRLGAREVTIDLRELEFMNSSCFKAFVAWVGAVDALPGERQYQIRFLSDERRLWQGRSLGALSCFAAHLVTVESG